MTSGNLKCYYERSRTSTKYRYVRSAYNGLQVRWYRTLPGQALGVPLGDCLIGDSLWIGRSDVFRN